LRNAAPYRRRSAESGRTYVLTEAAGRAVLILLSQQPDWDISAAPRTAEMSGNREASQLGVTFCQGSLNEVRAIPDPVSGSSPNSASTALDGETKPIQPLVTAAAATAEPVWPPTASTTAAVRDLTYASALLRVIENMHDQPNVDTLRSAVARHGTTLISADGIAIIRRTAGRWWPVIIRETYDEPDVVSVQRVVKLLAARGWLQHFERVDDLGQDDRWAALTVSSNVRTWRSLAVVARHRAGVAQGILMSRLGCSEDQALAILKTDPNAPTANYGSSPTRSSGSVT
jgi:hypothetical protein